MTIWSMLLLSFGYGQSLFDDTKVASIYLALPADSLAEMYANPEDIITHKATFVFANGTISDTVTQVGVRIRGNTSRDADKKSFKIIFNEYINGQTYQSEKKINLNGSHNDPTMIREKLFYDVWARAGGPKRRTAFVKLFINQVYYGLYTNLEEIDKNWLQGVFGENDGNLYKCTYPADLGYLGSNAQAYKDVQSSTVTGGRAYELQTNESQDNYADFVELITTLNQPIDAQFLTQIQQQLNVESVLRAFALDVATGNWDNYAFNKNNFYLYHNLSTGKFEFITYDTDNTFGVNWIQGQNWATRNYLSWLPSNQNRPLLQKLLMVQAYQTRYVELLDSITHFITHPDVIFPHIDSLHELITDAAAADIYRTQDYGFSLSDFHNGFSINNVTWHCPYGIKPFLALRASTTLSQLPAWAPHNTGTVKIKVYPNPTAETLFINSPNAAFDILTTVDIAGKTHTLPQTTIDTFSYTLDVSNLPNGTYWVLVKVKNKKQWLTFVKW